MAANIRQKKNAVRGRSDLVHGTGRVKPNGTIRGSDSNSSKNSAPEPAPLEPSKQRLVIEQGPTPLYCSDECRLADLNASRGIVDSDYNPDRQSPRRQFRFSHASLLCSPFPICFADGLYPARLGIIGYRWQVCHPLFLP